MSEGASGGSNRSSLAVFLCIVVILLGIGAIIVPEVAGLAVTLLVGWALLIAGVFELVHGFSSRTGGKVALHLLIGLLDVVAGVYMILHPGVGLATLTIFLAAIFMVDGIFTLAWGFRLRPAFGSGWLIFDGIVSLLLGILVWAHWPSSSVWFIGLLIGIRLVMEGSGRLFAPAVVKSLPA